MKTKVLIKDWNGIPAGTKFFLQDGMYYYKTTTEVDGWIDVEAVEGSCLFRDITALEFLYNVTLKDA